MAAMTRSRRSTDKADGMRLSSESRSSNQIRPASTTPCDSTHAATALSRAEEPSELNTAEELSFLGRGSHWPSLKSRRSTAATAKAEGGRSGGEGSIPVPLPPPNLVLKICKAWPFSICSRCHPNDYPNGG